MNDNRDRAFFLEKKQHLGLNYILMLIYLLVWRKYGRIFNPLFEFVINLVKNGGVDRMHESFYQFTNNPCTASIDCSKTRYIQHVQTDTQW